MPFILMLVVIASRIELPSKDIIPSVVKIAKVAEKYVPDKANLLNVN